MGKFRVLFIGDLMCQQNQIAAYKNDFSDVFAGVKEEFAQWDAVVANLETPVAPSMKVCHEPYSFNAPRAFLQAARNAGISVFLTANNHCLDRGTAGLLETMKEIEAAGGVYVGTRHADGAPYHVLTCGGVRIGLVAFTYGTNAFLNGVYLKKSEKFYVDMLQGQELKNRWGRWLFISSAFVARAARFALKKAKVVRSDRPMYEWENRDKNCTERFKAAIHECKKQVDYVIALPHVGGQYNKQPTEFTKQVCQMAVDAGADFVFANHEHVVHPIEIKETGTVVAYSLGNFVSENGVLQPPFEEDSEVSLGIGLEFDTGAQTVQCSGQLFCSKAENGRIKAYPMSKIIEKSTGQYPDPFLQYERVMNRIFNTRQQQYELTKCFVVR